ncbi:MAG: 5-oxoprolinase subunit PxpA [Bacteroidota bacterium]
MGNSRTIDLNCDLAELEDQSDLAIMPFISSCNIACGGHAGSEKLMDLAVQLANENGVTIGAHPGYPDQDNFGRISIRMSEKEIQKLIAEQVGLLQVIARDHSNEIKYVKLHGALYHDAASDESIAQSVLRGIQKINPRFGILGPPDTILERVARQSGFDYYNESFIDRKYQKDGRLVPRSKSNAVMEDLKDVEEQLKNIVLHHQVETIEGNSIQLKTDSICIHGDHPLAIENARLIREILDREGVNVQSFIH